MKLTTMIEIAASVLTVAAVALGTTLAAGAYTQGVAMVLWCWWTVRERKWSFIPMYAALSIVAALNLWRLV